MLYICSRLKVWILDPGTDKIGPNSNIGTSKYWFKQCIALSEFFHQKRLKSCALYSLIICFRFIFLSCPAQVYISGTSARKINFGYFRQVKPFVSFLGSFFTYSITTGSIETKKNVEWHQVYKKKSVKKRALK